MTGTFNVLNGNTEVIFTYTAETADALSIVSNAAKRIYLRVGVSNQPAFDTLSNLEKLEILDNYVKHAILKLANDQLSNEATKEAVSALTPYDF